MTAAKERLCGWILNLGKTDYKLALSWQRELVKMRLSGMARDTLVFLNHPPTITVGRDRHAENYERLKSKPLFIERGGDVTYHGPGQLVVYYIFNLTRRGRDLHKFMEHIQNGIKSTLKKIKIDASLGDEHTGLWVSGHKIVSVGLAVKQWVTFHGAAINLNTNLDDFKQINPCGLESEIMISAQKLLGKKVDERRFRKLLLNEYTNLFETDFYQIGLEDLAEDFVSQAGGYTI